jgi:hypothetical protein
VHVTVDTLQVVESVQHVLKGHTSQILEITTALYVSHQPINLQHKLLQGLVDAWLDFLASLLHALRVHCIHSEAI